MTNDVTTWSPSLHGGYFKLQERTEIHVLSNSLLKKSLNHPYIWYAQFCIYAIGREILKHIKMFEG